MNKRQRKKQAKLQPAVPQPKPIYQGDMLPSHTCFNPILYADKACDECGFSPRCRWERKRQYGRLKM